MLKERYDFLQELKTLLDKHDVKLVRDTAHIGYDGYTDGEYKVYEYTFESPNFTVGLDTIAEKR